ncbi:hypothetical protein K438DRAFT_1780996 [Mycena galopus ATCC 62051]|nr:hypothetical protein K438DRAFT_1780996 [Mycena galopus ATCC 62051]
MAIIETQKSRTIRAQDKNPPLPSAIANDPQLKEAESAFADALQTLRKECCLRGDDASIDELLDPQIEQEDSDLVFLRFAEGEEGTCEIWSISRVGKMMKKTRRIPRSQHFSSARRKPWMRLLFFKRSHIIGLIWMLLSHWLEISKNFALHLPRKRRRGRNQPKAPTKHRRENETKIHIDTMASSATVCLCLHWYICVLVGSREVSRGHGLEGEKCERRWSASNLENETQAGYEIGEREGLLIGVV